MEEELLKQLGSILRIPVEAFQNFDEEKAVNVISNTFNASDSATGFIYNNHPTFHPIDKLVHLHEEKIALYERMLKEKDEMIARFEKLLSKQ